MAGACGAWVGTKEKCRMGRKTYWTKILKARVLSAHLKVLSFLSHTYAP